MPAFGGGRKKDAYFPKINTNKLVKSQSIHIIGHVVRSLTVQKPPALGRYPRCDLRRLSVASQIHRGAGREGQRFVRLMTWDRTPLVMQPHTGTVDSPLNADH